MDDSKNSYKTHFSNFLEKNVEGFLVSIIDAFTNTKDIRYKDIIQLSFGLYYKKFFLVG